MAKVSKRYAEAAKLVDRSKTYSIEEAVKLAKETSKTKFDASVEVSFRLNVDVTLINKFVGQWYYLMELVKHNAFV